MDWAGALEMPTVVEGAPVGEVATVVAMPTVVASRADVPVAVAVEVVARGGVRVAVVPVGEVFSRAVL